MPEKNENDYELELSELLEEMGVAPQQQDTPISLEDVDDLSGIPLDESQVKTFSFDETPHQQNDDGEFPEDIFVGIDTAVSTEVFTEDGLSEDLRKQMLFDATLNEGKERIIDSSEFTDLISEVLSEQEEMETYSHFEQTSSLTDALKEQFESERQQEMLDVNNNILSIQNEEEEILEFILCEGIYSEPFKIFIHTSPLVQDGDMPLVIHLDGEYILFRRINPEPKVLKSILKVLPNFKFTHITPNGESPLNPFSMIDKCTFTN